MGHKEQYYKHFCLIIVFFYTIIPKLVFSSNCDRAFIHSSQLLYKSIFSGPEHQQSLNSALLMDFPFVTCVSVTMSNVAVNALERISLWTGVL